MERFQRTKYLTRVAELRMEMRHWVRLYTKMANAGDADGYTPAQIAMADSRLDWVEQLAVDLEELEDLLGEPMAPGEL
jgi:hypothetical protein